MHSLRQLQPPSVVNIEDLRRLAKRRLPKVIWDYLEGGAEDEVTLRRNRAAFDRYHLLPRMVTGKGSRDLSITLFGRCGQPPAITRTRTMCHSLWPLLNT